MAEVVALVLVVALWLAFRLGLLEVRCMKGGEAEWRSRETMGSRVKQQQGVVMAASSGSGVAIRGDDSECDGQEV